MKLQAHLAFWTCSLSFSLPNHSGIKLASDIMTHHQYIMLKQKIAFCSYIQLFKLYFEI